MNRNSRPAKNVLAIRHELGECSCRCKTRWIWKPRKSASEGNREIPGGNFQGRPKIEQSKFREKAPPQVLQEHQQRVEWQNKLPQSQAALATLLGVIFERKIQDSSGETLHTCGCFVHSWFILGQFHINFRAAWSTDSSPTSPFASSPRGWWRCCRKWRVELLLPMLVARLRHGPERISVNYPTRNR